MKLLTIIFLALLISPVYATDIHDLESCAKIYKSDKRLNCYDDKMEQIRMGEKTPATSNSNNKNRENTPTPPIKTHMESEEQYKEGISFSAFGTKYEKPDSIGSIWFSYKVGVTNSTPYEQKINIKYNAVDIDGFLIKDVRLRGTVPANSYKILSDKSYLESEEKSRVYKWELDK